LEKLVMESFVRSKNENDMGWLPSAKKGGVDSWVAAERKAYLNMINQE
jgi:hypothetical protein